MAGGWQALVLAAGRGPDDPMAKAYGVANKCLIEVAGQPMLARVLSALRQANVATKIAVVIEKPELVNGLADRPAAIVPAGSAPGSVLAALERGDVSYPLLVTTGDHALLTAAMVRHFSDAAWRTGADVAVALATAETILAAYPQSVRTFFRFGSTRVSGCNLFAIRNARALALLRLWQDLERNRKKPWRIVAAFGPIAIIRFLTGTLSLEKAFALVSRRLGFAVAPVLMPFAEAAIDVDKPADKELAETILAGRG